MTTESDEIWWEGECLKEKTRFESKHSDLKPGQVVKAFLGRYKRLKTQVIIIHTPLCKENELSDYQNPVYWVQRLRGNPHIESIKREDIDW